MKVIKTYKTPDAPDYIPLYSEIMGAPSVLIAGTPGSGKSVLLNGLVYNTLAEHTPAAKMFFVDPKRVELSRYKRLPHTIEIAKDPFAACDLLGRAADIMEKRYADMEKRGLVKTDAPPVYIFIDEIADIMLSECARDFLKLLQHLLALGRAAGFHTVACTQIPNRKILPAQIVANMSTRIALRCVSPIESRQIINMPGAEKLPKHGNAIMLNADGYRTIKNIPLIPDEKINARINFYASQKPKIKIVW